MIRLRVPWIVVMLLFALWTLRLYDYHLGDYADYQDPDSQDLALVLLNRSMRLSDELERQPRWLQVLLWHESRQSELEYLRDGLLQLHDDDLLDETGGSALAVVMAELGEKPPEELETDRLTEILLSGRPPDEDQLEYLNERLRGGAAGWWETVLARRAAEISANPQLAAALGPDREKGRLLFRRALIASGSVWVIFLAGLCLLPRALRIMRLGMARWEREKTRDYPWAWAGSLILAVFLLADLSANYMITLAYIFLATDESGFHFDFTLDLLWRAFAPAVALLILFRKPRHAIGALRLNGSACWQVVFGVFTLLVLADILLYLALGDWAEVDPTGGLDAMEAGWPGLVYGLVSACIAAPLVEEITYRGLLLRGLERPLGFKAAAIAVAIIFALGHNYDLYGLLSVGIFGFAAAIVYRATGSLTAAILLHALYNLTITLPSWWLYHAAL